MDRRINRCVDRCMDTHTRVDTIFCVTLLYIFRYAFDAYPSPCPTYMSRCMCIDMSINISTHMSIHTGYSVVAEAQLTEPFIRCKRLPKCDLDGVSYVITDML